MEDIIIRKVEKQDIPQVVDIQINGWRTTYRDIIDQKFLDSMNRIETIKKRQEDYAMNGFIVAELNGDIVGFCRYVDNNNFSPETKEADCELRAIYVKLDLKHHGIGTKLFQYVKNEFAEKEKQKMIIWCLKDNEASKKFYTKMGGEIISERSTKIGDKFYPEVCFAYNLKSH